MLTTCCKTIYYAELMINGCKIIEYDRKDVGSQYNWLLHNQLGNTIDNQNDQKHYHIDFGKPVSDAKS